MKAKEATESSDDSHAAAGAPGRRLKWALLVIPVLGYVLFTPLLDGGIHLFFEAHSDQELRHMLRFGHPIKGGGGSLSNRIYLCALRSDREVARGEALRCSGYVSPGYWQDDLFNELARRGGPESRLDLLRSLGGRRSGLAALGDRGESRGALPEGWAELFECVLMASNGESMQAVGAMESLAEILENGNEKEAEEASRVLGQYYQVRRVDPMRMRVVWMLRVPPRLKRVAPWIEALVKEIVASVTDPRWRDDAKDFLRRWKAIRP